MAEEDQLGGRDVDAEFEAIVAGFGAVADLPENLTDDLPVATDDDRLDLDPEVAPAGEPIVATPAPDPGIVEAALIDEGHFDPPPVELPPQEDLHFWGIVIGLTVGPLLLIWRTFVGTNFSTYWTYAAVALIIGGFALLVMRQPPHRDENDSDNGARV